MLLAQKDTLIHAFNIFQKPILNFYFYRPLSTQFYWQLGKSIFGWNPFGYHLVNLSLFFISTFLCFVLAKLITKQNKLALLTSFFYAYSGSNFYRLFFLSQSQELLLSTFVLLTIILFIKNSKFSLIAFILSLTSKETAVVVPIFLFVYMFFSNERKWSKLLPYILISGAYLVSRIFFFGLAKGSDYSYDLRPWKVLNNYFWYTLWALGLPEAYVNLKLFTFPTIINLKIFTEFGIWGNRTLLFLVSFVIYLFSKVKNNTFISLQFKNLFIGLSFFIIFLLPVGFFPFHKFPYSLGVPLFGISFIFASLIANLSKKVICILVLLYLGIFFSSYTFNMSNHWVISKSITALKVVTFFKDQFPNGVNYPNIYFRNSNNQFCTPIKEKFRFSEEVAYGIGGTDGLRVFYKNDNLQIFFEDLDNNRNLLSNSLMLDSRKFLR